MCILGAQAQLLKRRTQAAATAIMKLQMDVPMIHAQMTAHANSLVSGNGNVVASSSSSSENNTVTVLSSNQRGKQ